MDPEAVALNDKNGRVKMRDRTPVGQRADRRWAGAVAGARKPDVDTTERKSSGLRLSAAPLLAAVFCLCAFVITWAFVWGRRFERREPRIKLGAAPFVGKWEFRFTLAMLPAILIAGTTVWFLPKILRTLSDWGALAISAIGAAVFSFALAAADGLSAVLAPVVDPTEYLANLELLPKAGDLLLLHSNYEFLVDRTVHMKGHQPGFILLLKALAAIGLDAPWVVGALSFLGVLLIVLAVGVTVRCLADGASMRLVLPFLVLTPFAVWLGTSADAFFSGVAACGVATATVGVRSRQLRSRLLFGMASGLCLSGALFLTYGASTLFALVGVLVLTGAKRRWLSVLQFGAKAALAAASVTAVFYHFGFWWFDGLRLTNKFYWNGTAYFRTWTYFLLSNMAVLVIAVGPAVVAGATFLRDRRLWPAVGGALLCITIAEVSQYSKGEVERIWLLFMPWLVPAVASLARPTVSENSSFAQPVIPKVWLAGQAGLALFLQAALRSKW